MKKKFNKSNYPYRHEVRGEKGEPHTVYMLHPFDVHARTFRCPRCHKCVFWARNEHGKRIMISAEKDPYGHWFPIYHYYDCKGFK